MSKKSDYSRGAQRMNSDNHNFSSTPTGLMFNQAELNLNNESKKTDLENEILLLELIKTFIQFDDIKWQKKAIKELSDRLFEEEIPLKDFYTLTEVSRILGVGKRTLFNWLSDPKNSFTGIKDEKKNIWKIDRATLLKKKKELEN